MVEISTVYGGIVAGIQKNKTEEMLVHLTQIKAHLSGTYLKRKSSDTRLPFTYRIMLSSHVPVSLGNYDTFLLNYVVYPDKSAVELFNLKVHRLPSSDISASTCDNNP